MADMWDEALTALKNGPSGPPVPVTPTPKGDMSEEIQAKFRPEAVTSRLGAKKYLEQVAETPGWGPGMALAHGLTQGWLPEMLAIPKSGGLLEGGGTPDPGFDERYAKNVADIRAAREAFNSQRPGMGMVAEIGGSLATAIPAMAAGQEYIAAPLGARLAQSIPGLTGIVDFLSGASKAPLLKVPSRAARGALEGTEAALISAGMSEKPLTEQMKTGAAVGAVAGPLAGAIVDKLGSHVNPTTAESAQALLDAGVPVRAGQIPGANKVTQGLDKVFGGSPIAQREAFSEALTGHAGLPAKNIDQAWVSKNDQRIGTTMNNIQSVYAIPALEQGLINDLSTIRANAWNSLSVDNARKVNDFVDKIENNVLNPINGKIYKNLTQKNGILDNIARDKDIAGFAPQLREALDDAWGRALPADKKAAWDQARREYKVTRTIDDSMGASGAAEGQYNPKKLLKAVEDRYGNVENAGDLGKLARGGQFLAPPEAAPASESLGKKIGKGVLGLAAIGAGAEGSRVLTHAGPEFLAHAAQHPETYALPLMLTGLGIGGAKALHAGLNSQRATQYLLDVSMGSRNPLLMGNNPLIPLLVEGYNRQ